MDANEIVSDSKASIQPSVGASASPVPVPNLDFLAEGFHNPPDHAKPRVWWHWMNGNVTLEGVKLDLEWMKRIGVGGVHNFDGALDTTLYVEKPLIYMSPEWKQAKQYSVDLANLLGLEFTIASSAGWSETGGPSVRPNEAMKKLVWSETYLQGGIPFKGKIPKPPEKTGLFQNLPLLELGAGDDNSSTSSAFYSDTTVIAYRAPDSDVPLAELVPTIKSSAGPIGGMLAGESDLTARVFLPFEQAGHAWIQFSFDKPQRIQAITVVIGRHLGMNPLVEACERGWLEMSDDGQTFRKLIDLARSGAPQRTVSFSPVVARVFRIVLDRPELGAVELLGGITPPNAHEVLKLVLHTAPRVNHFEDKAGYSTRQILNDDDTPSVATEDLISKSGIVDVTSRMRPDGSLHWTPPSNGRWVVLRFGYSLIGRKNHPAPGTGTGLEVDKLNCKHVKLYIEKYLSEYEKMLGTELIGKHGLQYILMDSYEAGAQNWTDDMLHQFSLRRGYDAKPWLPVLTGRVVESAASSDRFLWDFRKTIGELTAEAHYGQISAALHERGLGCYRESHEFGRAFIGDGMEVKKTADIPMGAMWAARIPGATLENYDADILESASVAHVYGKKFVAAESFTAYGNAYAFTPQDLKPLADRMMVMGVNRFVIHASVHQPNETPGPGIGLGQFGQWFTRKETWAEQASDWIAYLTRSSYLLQQGQFVADIAYLYGDDTNVTSLFNQHAVPIPPGYRFDFVNSDALLNEFSVERGRLITRSGMEYRILALDSSTSRMSVPVLRKIRDLVLAGAVIVGVKPTKTPSLADDENLFHEMASEVWGADEHALGSGKVFTDRTIEEALTTIRISPDIIFNKSTDPELRFIHRRLENGDLYFVSNGSSDAKTLEISFRVTDKIPELWCADLATITPLSYLIEGGRTTVPLKLAPNDAVFVVFRRFAAEQHVIVEEKRIETLLILEGSWDVTFPLIRAAPILVRFDKLYSWTDSSDVEVKYFSGTAIYSKNLQIKSEWLRSNSRIHLDLGKVMNIAQISVNGHAIGVAWKSPFRIDITDALSAIDNHIEIKVTNLWPNRLIGDKQPGARKTSFAGFDPFKADSPLLQSGLLGPVTLLRVN